MSASFWFATFALLSIVLGPRVQAQDLSAEQLRGIDDNKPVAVLQKRFFVKKLRPELGLLLGSMLDEAYLSTSLTGARMSLFFSEWLGIELQYIDTSVTLSEDRKALTKLIFIDPTDENKERLVSPNPETNALRGMIDATLIVAPFYGKSNFFDWFIVYTDMYFSFGASKVTTDQGDLNAGVVSFGQRFYFTQSFSMRLDFRDRIYTEKRGGKDSTKNALSYDIGLSFFFL